jgi:hypothetical protein
VAVGVNGRPFDELIATDDKSLVVARVIRGWDVEENDRAYATLIDELGKFRETSPEAAEQLAKTIFTAVVEFGEDLPDMYWVHVAVLCSEMLVYGLRP